MVRSAKGHWSGNCPPVGRIHADLNLGRFDDELLDRDRQPKPAREVDTPKDRRQPSSISTTTRRGFVKRDNRLSIRQAPEPAYRMRVPPYVLHGENAMLKYLCHIGFVAAALTTIGLTAHAAPLGASARTLSAHNGIPLAEPAARRCWWRNGVRHCQRYGVFGYSGPHYPEAYRTGSSRWWQEMDREGRGGRGRR